MAGESAARRQFPALVFCDALMRNRQAKALTEFETYKAGTDWNKRSHLPCRSG